MIKILIADDSATETALLKSMFEAENDMQVIGCARNGKEAVELAAKLKPDLITMDIHMPIINGFEATQLIMMNNPVPIVVISSTLDDQNMNSTFLALEAGAVSVIEKPINALQPNFKSERKRMIDMIRAMAEIKVIKRKFKTSNINLLPLTAAKLDYKHSNYEVIAIGASVGGPQVLKNILSKLPADFPVPIAIVQHMTVGFIEGFCQWLNKQCNLAVKCVENQEILKPGTVYFAPENLHFKIIRANNSLIASLHHYEPVSGFCPSITVLLQSVANACDKRAIGILLTGMGSDGAQGLLEIKQKKGHTLVQDPKSSIVYGMAKVADSIGAVDKIIDIDQLVNYLVTITRLKER